MACIFLELNDEINEHPETKYSREMTELPEN